MLVKTPFGVCPECVGEPKQCQMYYCVDEKSQKRNMDLNVLNLCHVHRKWQCLCLIRRLLTDIRSLRRT